MKKKKQKTLQQIMGVQIIMKLLSFLIILV